MSKLPHFEDLVIKYPHYLNTEIMSSVMYTSMKFDGKMSFFIGRSEHGLYIANRSYSNKRPENRKICYNEHEIRTLYPDNLDVQESLIAILNFVKETYDETDIPVGWTLGGDYLYKIDDIQCDEVGYYVVPNIVKYRIDKVKYPVGFVLHSVYHDHVQGCIIDFFLSTVPKECNKLLETHMVDTTYISTKIYLRNYPNIVPNWKRCLFQLGDPAIKSVHIPTIIKFRNWLLRHNNPLKLLSLLASKPLFYRLFSDFCHDKIEDDEYRREIMWSYVNEDEVYDLLFKYAYAEELKYELMECASEYVNYSKTFRTMGIQGDLLETEGYVASIGSGTFKLVDRTSFSLRNFAKHDK